MYGNSRKFGVGNQVKIIYNDKGNEYVGLIGEIENLSIEDHYAYKIKGINSWFADEELELHTDNYRFVVSNNFTIGIDKAIKPDYRSRIRGDLEELN